MAEGHSVLFDDDACIIKNKQRGQVAARVLMEQNNTFPLEVSSNDDIALVTDGVDYSKLWHLHYGHLNVKGLQLLNNRGMVFGLPKINSITLCEGCIYGKQSKKQFPVGKSWRPPNA